MLAKEELRKKIKQLKYKIDKEESLKKQLEVKISNLNALQQLQLSTQKILKKINFKLNEKGMDMSDWLNCLPYDQPFEMQQLLEIGQQLGLHLNREQSNVMLNFFADDLSVFSSEQDFKGQCYKSGIRLK